MASPTFSFSSILLTFLLLGTAAASSDDLAVEKISFSYSGPTGPEHWISLDPNNTACAGKMQSPVNIMKNQTVNSNLTALTRTYKPANVSLVNNGFLVGIHYESEAGDVDIDGKTYSLVQMHWHSPSEHQIEGVQYAAELHLVHLASDKSISVVAILYQTGDPDPFLNKIKDGLDEMAKDKCSEDEVSVVKLGELDPKQLKRKSRRYYRYVGSLTSPPCTENVTWNILGKVRTISKEQLAALQAPLSSAFKSNARPVQPLNGRQIQLYDELD
ncbi:hypothetical protein SLE2022_124380 [Rubroshorea leprosula]